MSTKQEKYVDELERLIGKLKFMINITDEEFEKRNGKIKIKIRNLTRKFAKDLSVNHILKSYDNAIDIYSSLVNNIEFAIQTIEANNKKEIY
jgi:hypothetical protein